MQGQRRLPLKDATALDSVDTTESLKTIASQATLLVRGSCEHLLAFTRTLQPPLLSIAPFVCVRSALESSSIAAWLTEQAVTREKRIARSFAFRFEGQLQQGKLVDPADHATVAKLQARIVAIEAKAVHMGYPVTRTASGKLTMIATRWPGSTDTIKATLGMDKEYRILSSFAHGHPWAMTQVSYRQTATPNLIEQHLDPVALVWLCSVGAQSLSSAVWDTSEFVGLDSTSTRNLLNALYDELRITLPRVWI